MSFASILLVAATLAGTDSPTACISVETAIGCQTESQLDAIAALKGNAEAARHLADDMVLKAKCTLFTKGEPLYIDEESFLAELRRIHRPGDKLSFWVPTSSTTDTVNCRPTAAATPPPPPAAKGGSLRRAERADHAQPGSLPKTTAPANESHCEIKPVMTDADLEACRAAKSHD